MKRALLKLKEYMEHGDCGDPKLWPYFIIVGIVFSIMSIFYMWAWSQCHDATFDLGDSALAALVFFGIGLPFTFPIMWLSAIIGLMIGAKGRVYPFLSVVLAGVIMFVLYMLGVILM